MKPTLVRDTAENMTAALDVYDRGGNQLIKKGAALKGNTGSSLEKAGVPFVYVQDGIHAVHAVYRQETAAELLKVMNCFTASNGENAEILKRYGKDEIKRFLSASNETGNRIAYGHIFRYFASGFLQSLNENKKQVYDFLDYRGMESYQEYHAVNSACIAGVIAHNMGLKDGEKIDVMIGTLLCDIKMNLYGFVNLNRVLSETEREEMSQHAALSYDLTRKIYGIAGRAAQVASQHHERFNGSGYPKGLMGGAISLLSAIAAVADVYDAMTSLRPYRAAFTPAQAREFVVINKGGIFAPEVAEEFGRSVPAYFPGDMVLLSGGETAEVLENSYGLPLRPSIKLIEKTGKSVIISCNQNGQTVVKTLATIRQKET